VKGGEFLVFGNVRESTFTVQAPTKELQKPITFTDTKVEEIQNNTIMVHSRTLVRITPFQ
jgi:uncharacterized 2Fe-2S/4Fe-4S cluster protein (DUF4445 family)